MLHHRLRAAARGVSAAFSPSDVSGLAVWYDPSDMGTLWQDTAGTVPVTASGQAVARIDDKSGLGRHATQATASRRPLFIDSGGYKKLRFDGVDDYLVTSSFALGGSEICVVCGVTKNSDASSRAIFSNSNAATSEQGSYVLVAPSASGANSYRFVVRGTTANIIAGTGVFAAAPDTSVLSGRARIAPTYFNALRRNALPIEDNQVIVGPTNFANRELYIGSVSDPGLYHNGDIFSILIYSILPDFSTELPLLESWVNERTGAY